DLHRGQLHAHHIDIRTRMEQTPEIWADTGKLQVAFFHLVQNAEQAMMTAHGGGTLTIRVGKSRSGVKIEVADDGPGIPDDDLARIFNPFFTTKAPGEGRGLGLSVAYNIVAEHGGRLRADSRRGGGALFVIELPIGAPPANAIASAPVIPQASPCAGRLDRASSSPAFRRLSKGSNDRVE